MKVGIDLGTTNSAIAYIDEYGTPQIISNREGNRTTPSVVLFDEGTPIVGEVAKDESIINPENTIQFIKRYIGKKNGRYMLNGKAITPEGISALILKKLIFILFFRQEFQTNFNPLFYRIHYICIYIIIIDIEYS